MQRHILDKNRPTGTARPMRYADIERRMRLFGPHRAIEALRRQPKARGNGKVRAFLAMERMA